MKRTLKGAAVLLSLAFVFSLCACGACRALIKMRRTAREIGSDGVYVTYGIFQ